MVEIIIPSLYLLIGVSIYSSYTHFSIGLQRPFDYSQLLFGAMALFLTIFVFFHIQSLRAETMDEFVFALRWSLAFSMILLCSMFWFIALHTKRVPLPVSLGFTLIFAILMSVNLLQPGTLQFRRIEAIAKLRLPWGENLTHAMGSNSGWFLFGVLVLETTLFYWLYLFADDYLKNRNRTNFGMLLAVILLFISTSQGLLARMGVIQFVPLGMYGYLGMVIAMSMILIYDRNQKLRLANLIYEASNEGMMVTDQENRIIAINPAFSETTGYTLNDVMGLNPNILGSGRQDKHFYKRMWEEIQATGKWQGELWNKRKNGEIYPEWLSINTIHNHDGAVNMRIALFRDITKEKKSDELIWKQANFDELTGLLNRRSLNDRLESEIKNSGRFGLPLALILIDLDRFKETNDTLGHGIGDTLLREAGQRMLECIRNTDTIGRLGGDEFVIILGKLEDSNSVGRTADKLLDKLSAPYRFGDEVVYSSASIGITLYPEDATDLVTLMKNADQAMYAAKRMGRNCYRYFTLAMQKAADCRGRLSRDLHVALQENQFRLYFQPILNLQTGKISKAEALIRWLHPELGLVSPADFIPIAEDTGQIVEIGDWVFRQAASETARLRNTYHPDFQISINKSPAQFRRNTNNHFAWFDYLNELGLPGQSIVVEITESLLMEAREEISSHLLAFRDNGMQVALDDFGTGYSSLAYLRKFDIDYIKIDQVFVRNLAADSEDLALCEAMIVMAHKLGLKVIAEGVETEGQRDLLKQIHCDYGQGYLFSKAVPAEDFVKLLGKG